MKLNCFILNLKRTFTPQPLKKDNIPGYLSLSRGANAANRDIIISFMSEKQLSSEELKAYENVDIADLQDDLEALKLGGTNSRSSGKRNLNIVSKPPTSSAFGFCFSIPISFVYSIQSSETISRMAVRINNN